MNIRFRALAVMAMMALLASCGSGTIRWRRGRWRNVIHLEGNGDVAATVNGAQVPEALLDAVANGRGLDPGAGAAQAGPG